jgi:putative endonuclease
MQSGAYYEKKACQFLKMKGYSVIATNYRTRLGEIDIIARDKGCTAFIEVKGRRAHSSVSGFAAVHAAKRAKITYAAKIFSQKSPDAQYRFDVVAVEEGKEYLKFELIKNAFLEGE